MNNTNYIHALADALISQGRRYGLSGNTRAHLIEILSSVKVPCCKSETCDKDPSTPASTPGPVVGIEKAVGVAAGSKGADIGKLHDALRNLGLADGVDALEKLEIVETRATVPATAVPDALPTDEQVAEAVNATAAAATVAKQLIDNPGIRTEFGEPKV